MGSRRENPEAVMPLVEHLRELRSRAVICLLSGLVTSVIGYLWYSHALPLTWLHLKHFPTRIPSLGEILTTPYCSLPSPPRVDLTSDHTCRLLSTGPFDQFLLRFKIAVFAGTILACPVWLYQIWSFIAPGLKKTEKKYSIFFISTSIVLFIAGAVLAQEVLPTALKFLFFVGDKVQVTALEGAKYFNFLIHLVVIFGISFELPLFMIALNFVRILPARKIIAWQRGIIFGLFVFAAIVTPGQDPFSMLALALALTLLFELALIICIIHDRIFAKHARERDKKLYVDLPDNQPSPLDPIEPLPEQTPIEPLLEKPEKPAQREHLAKINSDTVATPSSEAVGNTTELSYDDIL